MTIPLFAALGQVLIKLLLGGAAVFLILLVLVQRGRGGGLAGALGGMGGSSAFGAKAGDVFTRITIVAAAVWIFLCIAAAKLGPSEESLIKTGTTASPTDSGAAGTEGPAMVGAREEEEADSEAGAEAAETVPVANDAAQEESAPGDETPQQ
ncbi:MAG: preprotein translocase subunit SecG [Planctomycetales bacterium]|nr:preprotein translocase subunit SecG [Planctomycetales bacterium]